MTFIIRKGKNLIYRSRQPERTALPLKSAPRFGERGGSMVTYSDLFTFVIMICTIVSLVRSVRNDTHDKHKK